MQLQSRGQLYSPHSVFAAVNRHGLNGGINHAPEIQIAAIGNVSAPLPIPPPVITEGDALEVCSDN